MPSSTSGILPIYTDLSGELLRFLRARLGDPAAAEDALQELWLRLQTIDSGPIANGRAYLYRAAQNVALDVVRARQREVTREHEWALMRGGEGEPVDQSLNAEADLLAREDEDALAAAIEALPEGARWAFRLHKIDGLSHAEVSADIQESFSNGRWIEISPLCGHARASTYRSRAAATWHHSIHPRRSFRAG